ncbi:MAG: mismatch-specific uracil-DNA glycosylase [Planctomycetaceae bacterium]|nr:mismatch-specific uracil-DNA glycosylase [Planctomycetaceae bacterium]
MSENVWKPTKSQILEASGKSLPDVIAPDLKVLFCGINPSLYSAAVGHHFARPGNRFWPTLFTAGFTDRLLSPFEDRLLLNFGCGISNVVERPSTSAAEVTVSEFVAGADLLRKKVALYRPKVIAVLGVGAFRTAFLCRDAVIGKQTLKIGDAQIWVLPNPSGLNAHYGREELARIFEEMRLEVFTNV